MLRKTGTDSAAETEAPAAAEAPEETEDAAEAEPVTKTYVIETDSSRKLIYIRTSACLADEKEMIFDDITAALEQNDVDNIIVDVKSNGGGDFNFVTDGICRAIFDKDVGWENYAYYPKNEITARLCEAELILNEVQPEDMGAYTRNREDFRASGEAKRSIIYMS